MQKLLLTIVLNLCLGFVFAQNDTLYPFEVSQIFSYDQAHVPGCEYYFLSPHEGYNNIDPDFRSLLIVADRTGEMLFFKAFPGTSNLNFNFIFDFKLQPNGQITYHNINDTSAHYVLDSNFLVVDTLTCKGNFPTDAHELLLTADGYRYNLCYDYRTFDLDTLMTIDNQPMGSNVLVEGNVIQIIDPNDQLVYQWNGFDYLDFADMDYTNLTTPNFVDWMHANSISLDDNGNMVISIRNFNEVIKISRQDSSIIWRLGGKNSDFAFPNDSLRFTLQHHATVLPNGNISILDNGTYHNPPVARAIEYALNATEDTANLVWDYRNPITSFALGSHQVLPNGNHLINWGSDLTSNNTGIVETGPNKDELVNIDLPIGFFSYRAFCFDLPWTPNRPEIECGYDSASSTASLTVADNFQSYYWLQLEDTTKDQIITTTGDYQVFGYNGFGWIGSETFTISDFSNPCDTIADSIPIGIQKHQNLLDQIILYPNPANELVQLKIPQSLSTQQLTLSIYNSLGQEVYRDLIFDSGMLTVSTEKMSQGTYHVKLRGNQLNWQRKLVLFK